MQKIIRVGNLPTSKFSGAGLHAYNLSGLEGYQTIFVSPNLDGDKLLPEKGDRAIYYSNFLYELGDGNRLLHIIKRLFGCFVFNIRCILLLLKENPQIVHVHSPFYLPLAIFSRLLGKANYITYHGSDYNQIKSSRLYAILAKVFDGAFYLGSHMAEGLDVIHGQGSAVEVFNGVDAENYSVVKDSREKTILAVGALKSEKGFDVLIRAFSAIARDPNYNAYKLRIAGAGDQYDMLTALVQSYGLEEKVNFLGHLSRDQIVSEYKRSELFVLSSISEGFPKVVLEAMAAGCKVAATNVGAVPVIMGCEAEELARPGDVESLVLELKKRLARDVESFEASLKSFSWENVRKPYLKMYQRGC